ncbi:MAG: spondin domain-containing protein [Granulosicoccus sp.]|nr:spondin domain-containing protein [Granulosicoccus sp.]
MMDLNFNRAALVGLLGSLTLIQACSSDSNDDDNDQGDDITPASFQISATNLTTGQPFSPPLLILHDGSYQLFSVGESAGNGLEVLAEGGDGSALTAEVTDLATVYATAAGDAPVGPGASGSWVISDPDNHSALSLTMATMLVNTNDAFTGINSMDLSALAVGESMDLTAIAYDSGTEANSESVGTIPGPADGGEGFNAARDDLNDQVTMHSGVVSQADGLSESILGEQHRFLNPVIHITVSRTE